MQFIDAQLEKINSQAVFAREQDRLEMIRTLHAARVDADNGTILDMEILLNLIGGIFKPDEEAAVDDESLQAAMSAQIRKTNYENRGMAMQERKALQKNPENRSPRQSSTDISKLVQVVFDMKAEMGSMRKALLEGGISFERSPKATKPRDQVLNGKQKTRFAGTAKKNKADKISQRSLVRVQPRDQVSDSEDDNYPSNLSVELIRI